MPLEYQPIQVNFGEGVDTGTDTKAVVPTKLLAAANVVFTSPVCLQPRIGWDLLETNANYKALAKHGDELMRIADDKVYPATGQNKNVSGIGGILRQARIRFANGQARNCDCAVS